MKVKQVEIAKEVIKSDGWWRFACGDVLDWRYRNFRVTYIFGLRRHLNTALFNYLLYISTAGAHRIGAVIDFRPTDRPSTHHFWAFKLAYTKYLGQSGTAIYSAEKIHHMLYFWKAGTLRILNLIQRGMSGEPTWQQWAAMGNNWYQWATMGQQLVQMGNNGQQCATKENNGQQLTKMCNNGQKWATIYGDSCICDAVFVDRVWTSWDPCEIWKA